MQHRVAIIRETPVRLNPAPVAPFMADFDGDFERLLIDPRLVPFRKRYCGLKFEGDSKIDFCTLKTGMYYLRSLRRRKMPTLLTEIFRRWPRNDDGSFRAPIQTSRVRWLERELLLRNIPRTLPPAPQFALEGRESTLSRVVIRRGVLLSGYINNTECIAPITLGRRLSLRMLTDTAMEKRAVMLERFIRATRFSISQFNYCERRPLKNDLAASMTPEARRMVAIANAVVHKHIKVAQFAREVEGAHHYHHGEADLTEAVARMAQDCSVFTPRDC
jgi:hypothetical protein